MLLAPCFQTLVTGPQAAYKWLKPWVFKTLNSAFGIVFVQIFCILVAEIFTSFLQSLK